MATYMHISHYYVLCCLLFCAASRSPKPILPEFVFIASRKPVDVAKKNGFTAKGTNDDVCEHVTGASCKDHTTAFIDADVNMEHAVNVWGPHLLSKQSGNFHVYMINATKNFYYCSLSLNLYTNLIKSYQIEKETNCVEKQVVVSPERWIAFDHIPRANILGVCTFSYDAEQDKLSLIANCSSIHDRTTKSHGNSRPYQSPNIFKPRRQSFTMTPGSAPCSDCYPDNVECDSKSLSGAEMIEAKTKHLEAKTPTLA